MTALFAALAVAAATNAAPAALDETEAFAALTSAPAISEDASAGEIMARCRAMVPENVTIRGHLNRRSRHGTQVAAYTYELKRRSGKTELAVFDRNGRQMKLPPEGRLLDTDITWSDLTLDFLQWPDAQIDELDLSESIHGVVCKVLRLSDGKRVMRIWVDRRTGAFLQAKELHGERVVRELFGTSIKKFGERWAPRNLEVGAPGARYRTKIVIDEIED